MKVAVCLALVWSAVLAKPAVITSTTVRERHYTRLASLPASTLQPSLAAQTKAESQKNEAEDHEAEEAIMEVAAAEASVDGVADDAYLSLTDPTEVRYTSDGKLSFSHFSRLAFLGKTASRLYNFVVKLFPAPDGPDSAAAGFSREFNSLQFAQQAFYLLYYDSQNLGAEIQQLFAMSPGIDFTLRDGLALLGFDRYYAQLFRTQNAGDELFKLLQEAVEEDIEEFREAVLAMLEAIEVLRNPHKFLYPRLKVYEEDYTDPQVLVTENDKIAQGQKMQGVFQNLKHELDERAQKVVTGVTVMFQVRAKVATKLKRMGALSTMPGEMRRSLLEEYRELKELKERQLVVVGSAGLSRLGLLALLLFGPLWR